MENPYLYTLKEHQRALLYEAICAELAREDQFAPGIEGMPLEEFTPQTFDELYKNRNIFYERLVVMPRKPEVQSAYDDFRIDPENGKKYTRNIDDRLTKQRIFLTENDFPYNIPAKHRTVWYRPQTLRKDIAHFLQGILREEQLGIEDFSIKINHNIFKSIKGRPHAHLFTRIKEGE